MYSVTFAIQHENRLCSEGELPSLQVEMKAHARLHYPLSGAICFQDPDGKVVKIEDALDYLFFHLVGEGWKQLKETGHLHLAHWEYEGSITLQIKDGMLSLQDNHENSHLLFEADPILEGLIACGKRYVTFLGTLKAENPSIPSEIQSLEACMRKAGSAKH